MTTALELTREGWMPYIEGAKRRIKPPEQIQEEQHKREELLVRIRKAGESLKSQFGVKRVILFGSLAHAGWFAPDSDVDLAVEGLIGDDYWRAWRLAEEVIGDRSVDFIDMEAAGESLKRAIERYGVEL
jgi:predicted nucleotidyltransferase